MKDLIKRYWDIFGGTICGLGLSYLVHWELTEIQLIYSIIILILVCIGLFKVVKSSIDKKMQRKKIVIDKVVDNQRPMRAINMAENPTKTGEDLATVLIDTMKGGKLIMEKIKNFFIWVFKYWQQLVGLIVAVGLYGVYLYALISDNLSFVLNVLPQTAHWQLCGKIGFGVIATLILAITLRNECKWVGIGSLEKAQEHIELKKQKIASQLSPTAKAELKKTIKTFETEHKKVIKEIALDEHKIKSIEENIKSLAELMKLGLGNQEEFNNLGAERQKTLADLNEAKQREDKLKTNIEKYKEAL